MVDSKSQRVAAFGKFAGVAGSRLIQRRVSQCGNNIKPEFTSSPIFSFCHQRMAYC